MKPGKPRHLESLGPQRKRVRCLKEPAECFKGRDRLQIDRDLFGLVIERTAVNESRCPTLADAPCLLLYCLRLSDQTSFFSMESNALTARAASPADGEDPNGQHLLQTYRGSAFRIWCNDRQRKDAMP